MYRRMAWTDSQMHDHDFLCCDKKGGAIELYMDGRQIELSQTNNKNEYIFQLPGGIEGKLTHDGHSEIFMFAIDNGVMQSFYEMAPPRIGTNRNIDNMARLAQFPPIASLSIKEFYALKALCTDNVHQCKHSAFQKEEIFINVSNKECDELTYKDINKPGSGFVKVSIDHDNWNYDPLYVNIRPGDSLVIYHKDLFGKETLVPIDNVSTATQFTSNNLAIGVFADRNVPFAIEGSNAVFITYDLSTEIEKLKTIMEQSGVRPEDLAKIITPSTTFHEFSEISNAIRSNVEITNQVLEELASGISLNEALDNIAEKEEREQEEIERK